MRGARRRRPAATAAARARAIGRPRRGRGAYGRRSTPHPPVAAPVLRRGRAPVPPSTASRSWAAPYSVPAPSPIVIVPAHPEPPCRRPARGAHRRGSTVTVLTIGCTRGRPAYPEWKMEIIEEIKTDLQGAMRAGERARVGALRLVLSELQKAAKEGADDELAVLRRERKRRLEAAAAYGEAGREDLATGEQAEAELIASYLPAELSDQELRAIVEQAVRE